MKRLPRLLLVLFLLSVLVVPAAPTFAQAAHQSALPFFAGCEQGTFSDTGAQWVICMPERLGVHGNGDLVIFVHGYVVPFPERPPEIPLDEYTVKVDGADAKVQDVINAKGYAFATTSFRTNGLAVKDGTADLMELLGQFKDTHRLAKSSHVYLLGFSEGGLITAKTIEKHQAQFAGGIAACGPIGDFQAQINYMGDMRIALDYYFKGLLTPSPLTPNGSLLPSPINIPEALMAGWQTVVVPIIARTLALHPAETQQLLAAMQLPVDPADPSTIPASVLGLLAYNIFATNDANAKLGGNPFGNVDRHYTDPAFDAAAERFTEDQNALAQINAQYQTTGRLKSPLVTLHNTGDPIVPYWHETLYAAKVAAADATDLHQNIAVNSWGHCNFSVDDIQNALAALVMMTQSR